MKLKTISSTEAQNKFGQLLDEATEGPVLVQKNGRDKVVIVSIADFKNIMTKNKVSPQVKSSLKRSLKKWDAVYKELAK